jgi:hypothetical protein
MSKASFSGTVFVAGYVVVARRQRITNRSFFTGMLQLLFGED